MQRVLHRIGLICEIVLCTTLYSPPLPPTVQYRLLHGMASVLVMNQVKVEASMSMRTRDTKSKKDGSRSEVKECTIGTDKRYLHYLWIYRAA